MNGTTPNLTELVARCAKLAYVVHGGMKVVEPADGCDPDAGAIAIVKAIAAGTAGASRSFQDWDAAYTSEEKNQFSLEDIQAFADDGDWTYEEQQRAESYFVDPSEEQYPPGDFIALDDPKPKPRPPGNGYDKGGAPPVILNPVMVAYAFPNPATIPPRGWLHGGHYLRRALTSTSAPGGFGKTSLSTYEAMTMARNGLCVWYLSGEDPKDEIDRRIAAHCRYHGEAHDDLEWQIFVDDNESYPISLGVEKNLGIVFDEAHVRAFEQRIKDYRLDVIFLDPLISFYRGGETNSILHQIADRLRRICSRNDCNIELVHHTRKIAPGQEITTDDSRGGGSLVNATRSARVLNRMTTVEAETARIKTSDRFRYLRIDNGKRNMAPPEDAKWFRLVSVDLPNGDNVQAVEPWEFPKAFGEVGQDDQDYFRGLVRKGNYRVDSRSPQWLGLELAEKYDRDPKVKGDVAWVATILKTWVENSVFKKVQRYDERRHKRWFYAPMDAEAEEDDETEP